MQLRRSFVALSLAGLLLALGLPAHAAAPSNAGRFIVTLKDGVGSRATAAEYHRRDGAGIEYVYDKVLNGFAGTFSDGALGDLARDGRVAGVERDGVAHTTEVAQSWGLDRIDQLYLDLDGVYNAGGAGSGVDAYVIDTGIDIAHPDFDGRAVWDVDEVDGSEQDCNGHGTHVAGTIGGATYGVAKQVTLHAVRVLDCSGSGTWAQVIAGMDYVAGVAKPGSVANMSLGGGYSSAVNASADNLAKVVTLAVAAGNSNANACSYSPSSTGRAVTVGATTSADARASYSNYGSCVDLFAPGSAITSDWLNGATNTISGTSMATPHVTGMAALVSSSDKTPQEVRDTLVGMATSGVVANPGSGSPTLLLNNDVASSHAPSVSLGRSCSGTRCTFTATARDADGDPATFSWSGATKGTTSSTSLGKTTGTASRTSTVSYSVTVTATSNGGSPSATLSITCTKRGSKTTCS